MQYIIAIYYLYYILHIIEIYYSIIAIIKQSLDIPLSKREMIVISRIYTLARDNENENSTSNFQLSREM